MFSTIMAKVTRVSGRGTKARKTDSKKSSSFSGKGFKEHQAKRDKATAGKYITTGRGTGRRLVGSKKSAASKSSKGATRVTGRGTGTRKSRG
ncbi:MAG: hypothetical protein CM1200mP23_4030 [Nitrososphaerota archaeon]|jgi:hypothetical protein|nr:MAG: hypothetical protein CM1200mP23_4030 [Nitrososphaerota archaeon]